jgi:hypothetical protein
VNQSRIDVQILVETKKQQQLSTHPREANRKPNNDASSAYRYQ